MSTVIAVIVFLLFAVPAIVLHEYAHGWMANFLGDSTAKRMGRLTLNPLKHVDPVGTVLLPLSLYFVHVIFSTPLVMFGWAKPVPVNFEALPNLRRDKILVALAGPLTNLAIAFVIAQIIRTGIGSGISELLFGAVSYNVALAVFNLLPIPPLDGSRVVSGFLPDGIDRAYARLEPYGIMVVIVLLNAGLFDFIEPVINGVIRWMGI